MIFAQFNIEYAHGTCLHMGHESNNLFSLDLSDVFFSQMMFRPGMVGLVPKWVRLVPNGTNPGLFQIRGAKCTEI